MVERFGHKKCVDSLVASGEFRSRRLDAGDGFVVGEGSVRREVFARYPVSKRLVNPCNRVWYAAGR